MSSNLRQLVSFYLLGMPFPDLPYEAHWETNPSTSIGELLITFLCVSLGMLAVGSFFGNDWKSALIFGALALATAPATTVLVLKESESEGPLTEAAEGLVILNNLGSIIVFELVFLVITVVGGEFPGSLLVGLKAFLTSVPASLALGVATGLVVSLGCSLLSNTRWLVLLVAANTFLLGLAEVLETNYMLGYLAMGLTVANSSDDARAINSNIDRLTGFLCVIFFVIHGAELDSMHSCRQVSSAWHTFCFEFWASTSVCLPPRPSVMNLPPFEAGWGQLCWRRRAPPLLSHP